MDTVFITQLIVSFVVGGAFIAFLSLAAEKANEKIAGAILSFPSTFAISLFFIGLVTSPAEAAHIIPSAFVPLGAVFVFLIVYVFTADRLSRTHLHKLLQIILSFGTSILAWGVLAVPVALFKPTSLLAMLPAYLALHVIAYFVLTLRVTENNTKVVIQYTGMQKVCRAIFSGAVISLAVFLSKTLDPFWGGIFTMFPAAFTSSLLVLHWYHAPDVLFRVVKGAPAGFFTIIAYMLTAILAFPATGVIWGTVISYLVAVVFFFVSARFRRA